MDFFSPLYLCILMSLYQFYIHHSKRRREWCTLPPPPPHSGRPTRLCSNSYSQGRPSTEEPRDTEGTRISISSYFAHLTSQVSSVWRSMHRCTLGWHDQGVAVTATGDVTRQPKCCSLWGTTLSNRWALVGAADCNWAWITHIHAVEVIINTVCEWKLKVPLVGQWHFEKED